MTETQSIESFIQNEITQNKTVLFMKGTKLMPMCGFSARVVEILRSLNVDFVAHNVLENDALRQGIKEFSNWPTIPQLYVNGEFIGGCDIITEMVQTGELQTLFSEE